MNFMARIILGVNGLKYMPKNATRIAYMSSVETSNLPPKQEPCTLSPPPAKISNCPQPPPCPEKLGTSCMGIDKCRPGDPCNYVPPECKDPDTPDLTKLKKLQCICQGNSHLPPYLRLPGDAFIYQLTLVLTAICTIITFYRVFEILRKQ